MCVIIVFLIQRGHSVEVSSSHTRKLSTKFFFKNKGELSTQTKTVNTFTTNQCLLNDMQKYKIPLGTRKSCKHFQKVRAKMDQSEHNYQRWPL